MGNLFICPIHSNSNELTDQYNLLLVEKGIRPAYLWYANGQIDRITPPAHSDLLEIIHIQQYKKHGIMDKYYFIQKNNIQLKEKIKSLSDQITESKILGYLYPKKLETDETKYHYVITFYCNKNIILWQEFADIDCNLNKFGNRLQEIKTVIPNTFLDIRIKKIKFSNPY